MQLNTSRLTLFNRPLLLSVAAVIVTGVLLAALAGGFFGERADAADDSPLANDDAATTASAPAEVQRGTSWDGSVGLVLTAIALVTVGTVLAGWQAALGIQGYETE